MSEVTDETAVIHGLGGRACNEISSMDPHHDRQGPPQRGGEVEVEGHKDVEVEAVLTDLLEIEKDAGQ